MGTNCLGPFLFTKLLLSHLLAAAKSSPPASVRIIWTTSVTVDTNASKGGITLSDLSTPPANKLLNYASSKSGNWFLASQFAKLLKKDGIVSLTQNPGNLSTKGWENAPKVAQVIFSYINHPPKYGAYTELWAGLSEEVGIEDGGRYAIPWGRWHGRPRKDILDALKTKEEGGTGQAGEFWKWCEDQTRRYA
jgi:NAD(P)-dependent dehydrogenase (short-subunit alcohol dehydrogenase family)